MTRSEKINAALEVLDFKLNKKFTSLIKLMKHKIENDLKLQDLMNYQEKYASTNINKVDHTITSIQLHHGMMNRLEEAINLQEQVVQDLEYKVNQQILLLQKDRAQNNALGMLVKRYHQQELQVSDREEQKEIDSQILAMLQSDISR